MYKHLQTDVIYFFTDTGQAAYSPDEIGLIWFDDLDEAQTETGIVKIIQTTEREFQREASREWAASTMKSLFERG